MRAKSERRLHRKRKAKLASYGRQLARNGKTPRNVDPSRGVYPQGPDAARVGDLVMPIDTISIDRLVICPSCGEPMRYTRTVPKVGDLPEMQTFECRLCRLAVTAEQVRGIMEMVSL